MLHKEKLIYKQLNNTFGNTGIQIEISSPHCSAQCATTIKMLNISQQKHRLYSSVRYQKKYI